MTHAKTHFLVLILNSAAGFSPHFLFSGMICVSEQCLKRCMWLKCVQWKNHKWFKYFFARGAHDRHCPRVVLCGKNTQSRT